MAAQVLEMALYDPKAKSEPMVPINFRVPKSVSDQLEAVVRLWCTYAIAKGEEHKHINASYVVRQLLRAGAAKAFEDFDGIPESEADWQKLEEVIRERSQQAAASSRRR